VDKSRVTSHLSPRAVWPGANFTQIPPIDKFTISAENDVVASKAWNVAFQYGLSVNA
jgi:hypothetical protein